MKKKLLLLSFFSLILIAGCTTSTTDESTGITTKITSNKYENKQYRLKIDFPSNRTFQENIYWATVMFFSPEQENKSSRENLGITIKLIHSGVNLEDLYLENKEVLAALSDDLLIENEKDVEIDYYPAKEVVYSFSQQDINFKQKQVLLIKEWLVYMFSYTATADNYKQHLKDADKMIYNASVR